MRIIGRRLHTLENAASSSVPYLTTCPLRALCSICSMSLRHSLVPSYLYRILSLTASHNSLISHLPHLWLPIILLGLATLHLHAHKTSHCLNIVFFFFAVLGFELRASHLLKQALYHLSHSASPSPHFLQDTTLRLSLPLIPTLSPHFLLEGSVHPLHSLTIVSVSFLMKILTCIVFMCKEASWGHNLCVISIRCSVYHYTTVSTIVFGMVPHA
jgi:hypothetical protein